MAAALNIKGETVHIRSGTSGFYEYFGTANFTTTDATCTLPIPFIKTVLEANVFWIGAPAADEIPSINQTVVGGVIGQTTGALTIKRTGAAPTSALPFAFRIRGR